MKQELLKRAARIGVTGRMGSGKSTLTELMRGEGMLVVHSDTLAKELMLNDAKLRAAIVKLLGDEAYTSKGLNREYIASRIFRDSELRSELESIVHPAVTREIEFVCANAPQTSAVVVESALILHTELQLSFDYIVLVDATDEVVLSRIAAEGRFSQEDARLRLADQNYAELPTSEADFVIENNGSREEFERRAKTIVAILKALLVRELPAIPLHQVVESEYEE